MIKALPVPVGRRPILLIPVGSVPILLIGGGFHIGGGVKKSLMQSSDSAKLQEINQSRLKYIFVPAFVFNL